ncbi:MAG: 50S ribosomal protein L29 [Alphaproteobacteria bacterium]|nr:50S ribosomal protein L29 [Alphaproteobacteria bacterium]NCQ66541.1 50S ribosomal protein L29 [Alphaproteobacteria bacterium]NCT08332.1 50S ribosomal protein L29 [Alphaproteobacteria bacterium]
MMKIEDLKKKTDSELKDLLLQNKREKLNLRIQKVNGQLESPAQVRKARKLVARIKTLMHQKHQVAKV